MRLLPSFGSVGITVQTIVKEWQQHSIDKLLFNVFVPKGFKSLSELLPRGSPDSSMQSYLQDLHVWTTHNKMKINYSKTKEMILGPLAKSTPDLLSAPSSADLPSGIERVKHFKLLGINISHDFSWQTHVDVITSKAATRLYFLKILKKSGLSQQHLLHFYLSVILPAKYDTDTVYTHVDKQYASMVSFRSGSLLLAVCHKDLSLAH